ncbi:unnamed protein product [Leptidea sinapis]|uniref:Uncharacterized protein n=1 Tax=Leptidea sinapis TaxID=189913 RepID=A0A5E4QIX7_9NEOP|nr:unnamed protein product [Leptidea sinapis]
MCNCFERISYILGNILYISQRLATCFAAGVALSCIIFTLIVMLSVGIGLGYNYCLVDTGTATPTTQDEFETIITLPTTTVNVSVARIDTPIVKPALFRGQRDDWHNEDLTRRRDSENESPIQEMARTEENNDEEWDDPVNAHVNKRAPLRPISYKSNSNYSQLLHKLRGINRNSTMPTFSYA